ncbi:OmpW family outer membrane protein [Luteibacter sp. PPL552]
MFNLRFVIAAAVLASAPAVSAAQEVTLPWILHVGAHEVSPTSNTGRLAGMRAGIDSDSQPTVSIEYRFTPNWSAEVLAALPFRHQVRLDGGNAVSVKQLPPVLGVNYRFLPERTVSPFLGVGVNRTHFFSAHGENALQGASVDVGDSWGIAWHAGVDVALSDRLIFTVDARYIDIDAKVKVNGAGVGTAHVDPWVYGFSVGYRF